MCQFVPVDQHRIPVLQDIAQMLSPNVSVAIMPRCALLCHCEFTPLCVSALSPLLCWDQCCYTRCIVVAVIRFTCNACQIESGGLVAVR